jgi:hypothetical protein
MSPILEIKKSKTKLKNHASQKQDIFCFDFATADSLELTARLLDIFAFGTKVRERVAKLMQK